MRPRNPSFAIVINIEPGELEWMGILLIASAHAFVRDDFRFHVHCRKPRVPNLSAFTRDFLAKAGAEFVEIENNFQPEYPQGNKLIATARERPEDYSIFMDTDMAFLRPCFLEDFVRPGAASVIPTETAKWRGGKTREGWAKVYEAAGVPFPKVRTRLSRRPLLNFPYFNAGMIGFESASAFGRTWIETARILDANPDVPKKRPWLDQIALPVAIQKAGLRIGEQDRRWNLALNYKHAKVTRDVNVVHYHTESWLRKKGLARELSQLLDTLQIARSVEDLKNKVNPGLIRRVLVLGSLQAPSPAGAGKRRKAGAKRAIEQLEPEAAVKRRRKRAAEQASAGAKTRATTGKVSRKKSADRSAVNLATPAPARGRRKGAAKARSGVLPA